eukprot:m.277262 g.277262  ORF g.277262 m.277262 type:complete len:300 (-) comp19372_c2_seq3:36-935(-)
MPTSGGVVLAGCVLASCCWPGVTPTLLPDDVVSSALLSHNPPSGSGSCTQHQATATDDDTVDNGHGGWQLPPVEHMALFPTATDVCNIDRVTPHEWRSHTLETPAILMSLPPATEFQSKCTRPSLLESYGNTEVVLSSANAHSYGKQRLPFRDYVASLQPRQLQDKADTSYYLFGDNDYEVWDNFTNHYRKPPFAYERDPFFSFGIGGSGSGVPFHTHGSVFAEVLYGTKRWFVTPPHAKPVFHPNETSLVWLHKRDTSIPVPELLDCTLGPNEVLYLPAQWWHATLNIGETVFISTFI